MSNINSITRFDTEFISASFVRPSNATQYTIGDVLAEVTTDNHMQFSGIFRQGKISTLISAAHIFSSANQSTKLAADLFLFPENITEAGDNAAFAPSDSELATCVGVIPFSADNWHVGDVTSGAGGNAMCSAVLPNGGLPVRGYSVSEGLWGVLVARNAYTPVSAESFTVKILTVKD